MLMKRALEIDKEFQIELIDDPRFRGVYLLSVQAADRELARRIRDLLVSRAAKTGDNGLSNEFACCDGVRVYAQAVGALLVLAGASGIVNVSCAVNAAT